MAWTSQWAFNSNLRRASLDYAVRPLGLKGRSKARIV